MMMLGHLLIVKCWPTRILQRQLVHEAKESVVGEELSEVLGAEYEAGAVGKVDEKEGEELCEVVVTEHGARAMGEVQAEVEEKLLRVVDMVLLVILVKRPSSQSPRKRSVMHL